MADSPLHVRPLRRGSWWRRHAPALRLVSCFLLITLATVFVWLFERSEPTVNLIWVANGLLLTYLLLAPRWRWPAYLIAGAAGMMVGSALIGESWQLDLVYNCLNLVEVLIGALLLRRKSTQLPRFTDGVYLIRFIAYAVLAGPIGSGAILTPIMAAWMHQPPLKIFFDWTVADGLGAAIIVPTFVAIFATRYGGAASLKRHWLYPVALAAITVIAFSQNRMPPLFILVFPVLVLLLMRLGLGWAALSTLFIAAAAGWFTLHNSGPFSVSSSVPPVEMSIQVQFFFACCIFMLYIVSVVMEDRRATELRLQQIASIHELVTDNSRDVILLADLDGRHTYVSPAVESINGWKPAELIKRKLSEHTHPDDRKKVEDAIHRLRHGSEGALIEYRAQKRNGEYIWVESSLRMYRDRRSGIPAGILSLVRDITERKHNENLLLGAYRALEELAVVDALTGVANRRRFDEYLANEWSWSARLQRPISLLLIDADSLKEQNDRYGHLRGDRCLKQIADAAACAASRPKDLIARFGGDEFAVILPDTDISGAVEVGAKIRAHLKSRSAEEEENTADLVTISIGCAAAVPKLGQDAAILIQMADEWLYRAKRAGRDQLCHGLLAQPSLSQDN